MPDVRSFLARFRPAAVPGAAGRRGVPADRVAEREAELAPVFALLEQTESEAARIRAEAENQAGTFRQQARQRAEAMLAQARLRADGERAAASNYAKGQADEERRRAEQDAAEAAARLTELARTRMPELVDRATAPVLAVLESIDRDAVGA